MAIDKDLRPDRDDELIRELRVIRPRPSEGFRRRLNERAAAGFPPRRPDHVESRDGDEPEPRHGRASLRERLRLPALRPAPILAGAAVVCAVATAIVVTDPVGRGPGDVADTASRELVATEEAQPEVGAAGQEGADDAVGAAEPAFNPDVARTADMDAPSSGGADAYMEAPDIAPAPPPGPGSAPGDAIAANRERRAVERRASIVLATDPPRVDEVAAGVLRVVDAQGGIVMSSTTRGGLEGEAGAEFALKIPSARLSETLADLSELAAVRHRSESAFDITAPTVSLADRLAEAQAKVRGLLKELAAAQSDEERRVIEIDLAPAQRQVARLRSRLDRLERRANFADVHVSVVTGEAGALPEQEGWTLGDAVDDALRVLVVVVGVMLVAAAVLVPIALLGLLGLVLYRVWLRGARERALRDDDPARRAGAPGAASDQPS